MTQPNGSPAGAKADVATHLPDPGRDPDPTRLAQLTETIAATETTLAELRAQRAQVIGALARAGWSWAAIGRAAGRDPSWAAQTARRYRVCDDGPSG